MHLVGHSLGGAISALVAEKRNSTNDAFPVVGIGLRRLPFEGTPVLNHSLGYAVIDNLCWESSVRSSPSSVGSIRSARPLARAADRV